MTNENANRLLLKKLEHLLTLRPDMGFARALIVLNVLPVNVSADVTVADYMRALYDERSEEVLDRLEAIT